MSEFVKQRAFRHAYASRYGWKDNKRVPISVVEGDVEMVVDIEGLFQRLSRSALRGKGGRAVLAGGLIVAKATNRKEEPAK